MQPPRASARAGGSGCSAVRHCSPCRALGSWPSTCPESRGSTRLTAPTWLALLRSRLDWSMLCPGPMIASENGKPTPNLRLAADEWPMARPTYTYVLPIRLALALAFKQKVPELTITYEDDAEVILDNLSKGGRFSHRRVGVA